MPRKKSVSIAKSSKSVNALTNYGVINRYSPFDSLPAKRIKLKEPEEATWSGDSQPEPIDANGDLLKRKVATRATCSTKQTASATPLDCAKSLSELLGSLFPSKTDGPLPAVASAGAAESTARRLSTQPAAGASSLVSAVVVPRPRGKLLKAALASKSVIRQQLNGDMIRPSADQLPSLSTSVAEGVHIDLPLQQLTALTSGTIKAARQKCLVSAPAPTLNKTPASAPMINALNKDNLKTDVPVKLNQSLVVDANVPTTKADALHQTESGSSRAHRIPASLKQKLSAMHKQFTHTEDTKQQSGLAAMAVSTSVVTSTELPVFVAAPTDYAATDLLVHTRSTASAAAILPLPAKYSRLLDIFSHVDQVVSLIYNRSEVCTFSRLKTSVEAVLRFTFNLSHLAQIKSVDGSLYVFKQQNQLVENGQRTSKYHLTVHPNLDELAADQSLNVVPDESSPPSSSSPAEHLPDSNCPTPAAAPARARASANTNASASTRRFTAACLLSRRRRFARRLQQLVEQTHVTFVNNLVERTDARFILTDPVQCWHPKFPLEAVPDIIPATLPVAPSAQSDVVGVEHIMNNEKLKMLPQVQRALEKLRSPDKFASTGSPEEEGLEKSENRESGGEQSVKLKPVTVGKDLKEVLKDVDPCLLERVRARERLKEAERLVHGSEADAERRRLLAGLPGLVRSVRHLFQVERRPALPADIVVQRLAASLSLSAGLVRQQLGLLQQLCPKLIVNVRITGGAFIKFDSTIELNSVLQVVQQQQQQQQQL